MKARVFIIIILSMALMSGCVTIDFGNTVRGSGNVVNESRAVSGFDEVSLRGVGTLILEQGETEGVEIEAEDNIIDLIETKVVGDKLIVETKPGYNLRPTRGINIYVSLIDISAVDLSGSGDILADELESEDLRIEVSGSGNADIAAITTESMAFKIAGSGDLDIDTLEADTLNVVVAGSGTIEVAGNVAEQSIDVSGSGELRAADLESETADVVIAGSGTATIWVQENLDIKVLGSGTINYYGTPTINQTVAGSGDINSRGDR
ncbi:MAG: DUF2807 domain-containing protein [Anaerolineales bacterium]|nr:DUF2807 domain-containing protein [Anaerolineales bacterium]